MNVREFREEYRDDLPPRLLKIMGDRVFKGMPIEHFFLRCASGTVHGVGEKTTNILEELLDGES